MSTSIISGSHPPTAPPTPRHTPSLSRSCSTHLPPKLTCPPSALHHPPPLRCPIRRRLSIYLLRSLHPRLVPRPYPVRQLFYHHRLVLSPRPVLRSTNDARGLDDVKISHPTALLRICSLQCPLWCSQGSGVLGVILKPTTLRLRVLGSPDPLSN